MPGGNLSLCGAAVGNQNPVARIAVPGNLDEGDSQLLRVDVQLFLQHFRDAFHSSALLLDGAAFQQCDLYVRHVSLRKALARVTAEIREEDPLDSPCVW